MGMILRQAILTEENVTAVLSDIILMSDNKPLLSSSP
jgi:hypothetical protein